MTVYIVTQAWEGEIIGVFADERDADALVETIRANRNHRPVSVEAHDVQPSTAGTLVATPLEEGD